MVSVRALLRGRSGVQAGLLMLTASLFGHLGNYLFYVVAAQMLGAARFAEVAAMVALSYIFIWPVNGLQAAAGRDVARLRAAEQPAMLAGLVQMLIRGSLVGGLFLGAVLLGLSPLIADWLDLTSVSLAVVTALWVALIVVLTVLSGVVFGMENFGRMAVLLAGPLGLLRAVLLPIGLILLGLNGAMWAMVGATVVGLFLIVTPTRQLAGAQVPARATFRPGAAILCLFAFAVLTNVDQLVAKATLDPLIAGTYSGAALIGKIALYAPAALGLVLMPRAAAALERGERADRPVLLTLCVTAVTGLSIAGALALIPASLLSLTLGSEFAAGASLLAPLALVMTAAALLQVHLIFAVARGSKAFTVLITAAAAATLGLLSVWHATPGQIVASIGAVMGTTLLIHELTSQYGAIRMILAILRRTAESEGSIKREN